MRPKIPLISKREVCEVALDMIDNGGIDSLSIRKLAERIGVNGASLYHHFKNKDDIVVGAALLALSEIRTPKTTDAEWQQWFLDNTIRLRNVLRRHPDLIPVLIDRDLLRLGLSEIDSTFGLLERQGLPIGLTAILMETLEKFVFGTIMYERTVHPSQGKLDDEKYPNYARAIRQRGVSPDEAFEMGCRKLIEGIAEMATWPAASERRKGHRTAAASAPAPKSAAKPRKVTAGAGSSARPGAATPARRADKSARSRAPG